MKETGSDSSIEIIDKSFNEKRKWQIALRRYIINKNKSVAYAAYFGIDIEGFRNWIECQFDETMSWDTFSNTWQLEHVVSVAYFNMEKEDDLKLCWNFLNIKVEKLNATEKIYKPPVHASKAYFEILYQQTGIEICNQLVSKIDAIPKPTYMPLPNQINFLKEHTEDFIALTQFSAYEFERMNGGDSIKTLLAERELMKRFG